MYVGGHSVYWLLLLLFTNNIILNIGWLTNAIKHRTVDLQNEKVPRATVDYIMFCNSFVRKSTLL